MKKKVLMFTKDTEWCRIAREFVAANFDAQFIVLPRDQEKYWMSCRHAGFSGFEYDYVISYLCPEILPKNILELGKVALNFHPAPPKYPGIGGYNFAIFNQDQEYGVTMHHMVEKVDSGEIIDTWYFPIFETDTVKSLKERSMNELLNLFFTWMSELVQYGKFTTLENRRCYEWEHEPYTRLDLQKLCKIDLTDQIPDDSNLLYDTTYCLDFDKIGRQIRATYFPSALDGPYIEINDKKWRLIPENE